MIITNLTKMADTNFIPSFHKTRIAPTPSGYLHLGNVFSFVLTTALAEKYGANTLLRIDDIDRQRVRREYVQDIFDTLQFLDIPWQEGPQNAEEFEKQYAQRHRMDHYNQLLERLRTKQLLFACDCSRKMLGKNIYAGQCMHKAISLNAEGVSWRLITHPGAPLTIQENNRIIPATLPSQQHYFIVRKKDGLPAYQLCSFADDLYFEVDLVVRGIDLWPSSLAQTYLSQVCDDSTFRKTSFFHHALVKDDTGRKLSKSEGATSIRYLRKKGVTPGQIFTHIAGLAGISGTVSTRKELGARLLALYAGPK